MAEGPHEHDNRPSLWPAALAASLLIAGLAFVFRGPAEAPVRIPPDVSIPPIATTTSDGGRTGFDGPLPPPPGWTELPAGALSARIGHTAIWTGSELIVWGGRSLLGARDSGAIYSQDTARWTVMPHSPIDSGPRSVTTWTGREMFAFSGEAATFDRGGVMWQPLETSSRFPAHPLAAAWTGSDVVVVGYQTHPPYVEGNTLSVAVTPGAPCCRVLPDPPIDFSHARAIWTGEEMLLVGGFETAGTASPRFAAFEPDTETWHVREPPPVSGAHPLAAAWTGDELVVLDYMLDAAAWKPGSDWRSLPQPPFEDRGCLPRAVAAANVVFVWYCRQAALYDPDGRGWTRVAAPLLEAHAVSTSCLPVAADEVILMWCGNEPAEPFFWEIDPRRVVAISGPSRSLGG